MGNGKDIRNMGLPEVEFEGPLGRFWDMEEVPFEAMINGTVDILHELFRRGYKEEVILECIKRKMTARAKKIVI